MKCNKCGYEDFLDFDVCPQCGSGAGNSSGGGLAGVLSSPLYLVMCILMSVYVGVSFFSTFMIQLIPTLIMVFMWVAFTNAQNGKGLRALSGTIFAQYIINYVSAGFMVILGLILPAIWSLFKNVFGNIIEEAFAEALGESYYMYVDQILDASAAVIAVAFIIAAVLMVVFNVFAIGSIHSFTKAAYTGTSPKMGGAAVWLFIIGGFNALSALGSLFSLNLWGFLSSLALAGVTIIAGILVGKCK